MINFKDPENRICPICESMLIPYVNDKRVASIYKYFECKNGCYAIKLQPGFDLNYSYLILSITMGHNWEDQTFHHAELDDNFEDTVQERINYWRENYRYLAEILERS